MALFVAIGGAFLCVNLLVGWLVRPREPNTEKLEVYECGEPTIGSSFVQFDLRFYVVALLFIIFDVEVAFFFPWATIFGGATTLLDPRTSEAARTQLSEKLLNYAPGTIPSANIIDPATAERIAWLGLSDILVFFAILLVAFAYVWKRGDLDWVRAISRARVAGATRRDANGISSPAPRPLETVA
ncbi:MAG: NADH-quinone oxidoreductase subunit A [Planctomycetaceae bacterium]